MSAYAPASPAAYKQQSILTAPPERLLVMLYEGMGRFLFQAAHAMRSGDQRTADDRMRRGEAIIDHLNETLDMSQGKLAENLEGIYVFCKRQLLEARMERDPAKIDTARRLLGELGEAWAEIAAP
jgi:flagellar protein FliS